LSRKKLGIETEKKLNFFALGVGGIEQIQQDDKVESKKVP
jgi:hypothetical protein